MVKREPKVFGTSVEDHKVTTVGKLFEHFCQWYRLEKFVAWMLRYRENPPLAVQRRTTGSLPQAKYARLIPITVEELQRAETEMFKYVQRQEFAEEIGILEVTRNESREEGLKEKKKRQLRGSSRIFALDPQLLDGLLRVGGRLGNA